MGKGARIKRERAEGKRTKGSVYWSERGLKPGMTMMIPKFALVESGRAEPHLIPTPNKLKKKFK